MAGPLLSISPRQALPAGAHHHLLELPRALTDGVHGRLRRTRVVSSLTVAFLPLFLLSAFFAYRHLRSAVRASLPAHADVQSSILPLLFPGYGVVRVPAPAPSPEPASSRSSVSFPAEGAGVTPDCDFFDGEWVRDDADPWYQPKSCPFAEEAFDCVGNGRPDSGYMKLRWKPKECELPSCITYELP